MSVGLQVYQAFRCCQRSEQADTNILKPRGKTYMRLLKTIQEFSTDYNYDCDSDLWPKRMNRGHEVVMTNNAMVY